MEGSDEIRAHLIAEKGVFATASTSRANSCPIELKWVDKIKRLPDGSMERYKAQLVARGFAQKLDLFTTRSLTRSR
jgi:hypothetical protein